MRLFQARHFNKIAEIAARMDLSVEQLQTLTLCLVGTNPNYNTMRFREEVESFRLHIEHEKGMKEYRERMKKHV